MSVLEKYISTKRHDGDEDDDDDDRKDVGKEVLVWRRSIR